MFHLLLTFGLVMYLVAACSFGCMPHQCLLVKKVAPNYAFRRVWSVRIDAVRVGFAC